MISHYQSLKKKDELQIRNEEVGRPGKAKKFDAQFKTMLEHLTTLSAAVKDLPDGITSRTKKSVNQSGKGKTRPLNKARKANPFPSVTPFTITQSEDT